MKTSLNFAVALLLSIALSGCATGKKPPCCREALPGVAPTDASLYQLDSNWTSDMKKEIKLGVFQGRPQVVAMFFASCEFACPILVNDMKRLQAQLPKSIQHKVNFTLISFDFERDSPVVLNTYRQRQNLSPENWSLLTGKPDDVRELAALLGVNYQKDARGQFSHSNIITVLNSDGEIVHQQTGLNQDNFATVKAVEQAITRMQ